MEPLKPVFREALKEAHPGLSDEVIDRAEELLAQRFLLDPESEPLRVKQLDQERAELLRQEMPKFEEVFQITSGREETS